MTIRSIASDGAADPMIQFSGEDVAALMLIRWSTTGERPPLESVVYAIGRGWLGPDGLTDEGIAACRSLKSRSLPYLSAEDRARVLGRAP